ncbi:helix-turn-helix domain-containing protein [Puia dinghuensis]|uniref:Transcriptional regulator n=1 Tax=Puia dinghuensis TaxID=1792502 RepID=A0A8J2UBS0_9BACT|nr:XRE family transcriptional regulator [Puia dinghuensis]GGA94924.1 transcriptional regulator [Puia dinghuensis]
MIAKHFPERLKTARKMTGYSLQDLSDMLKNQLNKQALQRLETGEAKPDSATLSSLAKVLQVPPEYFFREYTVELKELSFRKLKKLPVREQEKIKASTVEYLERYLELEDILGLESRLPFKPKSFKIKNREDVEKAATEIRMTWCLGDDPLPNILEMLEENHIKVILLKADNSFSGMSTILNDRIAVIVLNNSEGIPIVRRRFSALHELAHLYMDLSPFTEKDAEKFCDAFACALLLPAKKIKIALGGFRSVLLLKELAIIAGQYGISLAAIAYRALALEIISATYHKYFMISYNRDRIREREFEVYSGREHSDRFLQLLIRAVAEEVISTAKAAALYNQKLGDFRDTIDNAFR